MLKENWKSGLSSLYIVLAASCWGIIGIFTRMLLANGCTPEQISFIRCALATIFIWIFLLIFDRQKLRIMAKDIWMFAGTGVMSLAFFSIMYFKTQRTASLSVAAVLLYTAPSFVMIFSAIFFRERITGRKIFALILAFTAFVFTTGLLKSIITGTAEAVPNSAIITGVASGIAYSLYSIFGKAALKRYSSATLTAYTMLFASLALLPFAADRFLLSALSKEGSLKSALGISLISTVIPYLLYSQGLKHTEPGKASVMAFVEPVVATLTGILLFREIMTVGGVLGIVLIFISILILNGGKEKTVTNSKGGKHAV